MDIFQISSAVISGLALLIALISSRQKKMDKETTKEIDIMKDLAIIKQDLYANRLGDRVGKLERDLSVLDERLDNEIKGLEKLDEKLDEIRNKITEDE